MYVYIYIQIVLGKFKANFVLLNLCDKLKGLTESFSFFPFFDILMMLGKMYVCVCVHNKGLLLSLFLTVGRTIVERTQ